MKFDFKDIGKVHAASIEVKGLTVLTGLNDSGKTFLTKCIYSLIKTANKANEQALFDKIANVRSLTNQLVVIYRQSIRSLSQEQYLVFNTLHQRISTAFSNRLSQGEIISLVNEARSKFLNDLATSPFPKEVENITKSITATYDQILSYASVDENEEYKFTSFYQNVFIRNLFQGQLNLISSDITSEMNVSEGDLRILKLEIADNKIENFESFNDILFEDATLIESPIILQLSNLITNYVASQDSLKGAYIADLPYHFKDLIDKIRRNTGLIPPHLSHISDALKKIINGQVSFDLQQSNILFDTPRGKIKVNNIANGIKSFGLLQMLLSSGSFDKGRSLLIIDEPEVHLHPKWEVEYAKIICQLCKAGVSIVLSSHSPYMLEALIENAKKYDIQEVTKFYFGSQKESESGTSFEEVSTKLDVIFKTLADPMTDLIINS